jgi:hypothetical protein
MPANLSLAFSHSQWDGGTAFARIKKSLRNIRPQITGLPVNTICAQGIRVRIPVTAKSLFYGFFTARLSCSNNLGL